MALSDATLAQLAKKRAGIGPVTTGALQGGAAITAPNADPANNGEGVDVADAVLAVVKVRPDAGAPIFSVWSRTEGTDDEFEQLNHLISKSCSPGKPWKEIVFVGSEVELYVVIESMGGASTIDVLIEACNG